MEIKHLQASIEAQAQKRIQTGMVLDYEVMLEFAMILDEAIAAILRYEDALEPIVQIGAVAAYLRRADVEGRVIAIA